MELSKVLEKELLEGRFWTHSKTLVEGCKKVSPGCQNCWSEAMQMRFNAGKPFDGTIVEHPERCADILPKSSSRKPRVWTYWNDMFHLDVSDELRDRLFRNFANVNDFHIICTKRPYRAMEYLARGKKPLFAQFKEWPPPNVIIMVTMENQDMVDTRMPEAVSMAETGWKIGALIEPMLSPIKIQRSDMVCLEWVICGPENGKGKRPFDGQWAMRLQRQAELAEVPFFYKAGLLNGKRYIETP